MRHTAVYKIAVLQKCDCQQKRKLGGILSQQPDLKGKEREKTQSVCRVKS